MSFRIKLGGAFLSILFLLVVVALTSWWGMSSALGQQERLYNLRNELESKFHLMISEEQSFITEEKIPHSRAVFSIIAEIQATVGEAFNKTEESVVQKEEPSILLAIRQYEKSFSEYVEHTITMQTMRSRMIQESKRMLANARDLRKVGVNAGEIEILMNRAMLAEKDYLLYRQKTALEEFNEKTDQIVLLAKNIQSDTNSNSVKLTAFRIGKVAEIYRTSVNQFAEKITKQHQALALMQQSLKEFDRELSSIISQASASTRNKVDSHKLLTLIIFFAAALLSIIATYVLSDLISKPIKQLTESAKSIIGGNLNTSVKIDTQDEIGELGQIFNRMTQQLKTSFSDTEKYRDHLEELVRGRTAELKESEAKFRSIIESSPMGVHMWELNHEGKLIFSGYNPAADTILKTDNSQFIGREILDAFPLLAETVVPQKYREVCETGLGWQTNQVAYDDNSIKGVFEVHAFQTSPGKMAAFFLDVTESHTMQSIIAQSEKRMQMALDAADVAVWDWNIQTGETYFSPKYFTMLGYNPDELSCSFETWSTLLHEDDRDQAIAHIKHCLEKRQGWDIEFRLMTKENRYRWIRGRGTIIAVAEDGSPLQASGTHLDITDDKLAKEVLRKSEATLQSILVAAPVGIGLVHNRVFSWVSERIAEMTGYQVSELIGKSARMLYPTEEEFLRVGKVKYDQLKKHNAGEVNTVWRRKSGEIINIHLRSSPIDPADVSLGVTFSALDITEKLRDEANVRRLEQQVQQTKNIESLGVLAGGIAHDFNNILMAVLGNLSLASQSIPQDSKEHLLIAEAEKASLRARDLTQQLLTFSKGGEPIKETASLTEIIVDSTNFILRGSPVACSYDIPADLWLVDIDKGQMSQVIQNIIINAKNAMPKGGTIAVTCRNIHNIEKENTLLPSNQRYTKITITDQGIGIPANMLDKIFEPYFTTKQEGSGLGLAITYSIIARHQGSITAQSEVGSGTSFFIYLPASENSIDIVTETKPASHVQNFRVLVMDDDEMVRMVSKAMLTSLGHEVLLANDGHEAISLYGHPHETIDLIIMDLTIPGGMGGKEAAQEILKIDPHAKIIVSSGYSNDPIMANFTDYGFCSAIVKPYQIKELADVISELMG